MITSTAVPANGQACRQCGERPVWLLAYATEFDLAGEPFKLEHDGLFCTRICHDAFYRVPTIKAE
jgi:hypothetical protein